MKTCPVCGATYADSNAFCPVDGTTLRAADPDGDLIGSVVADRYLVTDLLGEGGMGKVYLARHVRLPQQAAIKVLRPEQVRDAASVARFTREAANASRIDHDRVARVYDFGETSDGTVYLAMEYVAGRTLARLIADEGVLPPTRTAALTRQIADGLDAAHRLGIVHRDLKPDNVLVIEGEHDDRVKVVDFGIAKAFGAGAGEGDGPALTRTGFVVGTPEFMSPEQLLGDAVDARSDVYALALLAYQCLTGDLPFSRDTPDRGLTARLVEPPRTLQAVAPLVPWSPALQHVFDAALARHVDSRPASAGAFARALAAAVDDWATRPGREPAADTAPPVAAPPSAAMAHAAPVDVGATAPLRAPAEVAPAPAEAPIAHPPAAHTPAPRPAVAATTARPRQDEPPAPAEGSGRRRLVLAGGAALVVAVATFAVTRGGSAGPAPAGRRSVEETPATTPVGVADAAPAASGAASAGTVGGSAPPPSPTGPVVGSGNSAPVRRQPSSPSSSALPDTQAARAPRAETPTTSVATPPLASDAGARRTLDSLEQALNPNTANAENGRAGVAAVRALLPRLHTARDSTWAYVRLIDASLLTGDQARACTALRGAQSVARTPDQREALRRYDEALGCN